VQYFKDRTAELRWLQQQVAKKQVRLVLVCGRGGMGKTALVSKFLEDIIEQDRDVKRICVTLKQAQYRSPDKIMELICETLEQREVRELKEKWQEGASLSEKLEFLFRRSLGRRQCFLVLDNCEDILDEDNRV
jgi:Cdc6-like AAA superfamily ATPase